MDLLSPEEWAAVALSLFLLPRLKGIFVAVQWAKRMHGFSPDPDEGDE